VGIPATFSTYFYIYDYLSVQIHCVVFEQFVFLNKVIKRGIYVQYLVVKVLTKSHQHLSVILIMKTIWDFSINYDV
jgi:hypothetical protein